MSPWSGKSDRKSKYVDKQDEIRRETLVFQGIFSVMGPSGSASRTGSIPLTAALRNLHLRGAESSPKAPKGKRRMTGYGKFKCRGTLSSNRRF